MYSHYIDFLKSVNADTHSHSGRTFLGHLQGTYELLKSWGCDEHVCRAGLFHSIYGSSAFKTQCVSFDERNRIRDLIGLDAERLSYLFCVTSRPGALLEMIENGWAIHRISGETIAVDRTVVSQLLQVECANLIEQGGGRKFFASLLEKNNIDQEILRPEIINAIGEHMSDMANRRVPVASIRQLSLPPLLKQSNRKMTYPIQLRLCREEDVDQIALLARQLHVDSRYASIPYKKDLVKKRLIDALKDPRCCCILALRNEEIIGFLSGSLEELFFSKVKVATCRFLYAVRKERGLIAHRLLRSFILWAKKMDAKECRLDDTFGGNNERAQQLFAHLGMKNTGGIYSFWL